MLKFHRRNVIALPFASAATAATRSAHAQGTTVRYSTGQGITNPKVQAARRFGELAEQRSGGALRFAYFENGQLYQDRDEPQALRQGSIQMATIAAVFLDAAVPNTQIYGLPFMFGASPAQAKALAKSEVGRTIEQQIERRLSARVLGTWYSGTTMYVSRRQVRRPEDFKGMRVRVAGSKLWEEYTRALGASPVAVSFGELFTAAQQGLIDAIDSNANALSGIRIAQVMKYGIRTDHSTIVHMLAFNGGFWQSLPRATQTMLEEVAAETLEWEWDRGIAQMDESYQKLISEGMTIHTPSTEEIAAFRAQILPLQESYLRANPNIDADLVRRAAAIVDA
jgi:tripartite ATP-independent transporter DctP family solute receptor